MLAPQPPLSPETGAERRGFRVSWRASPSADVSGYLVYRAAYAGAPWQKLGRSSAGQPFFLDRGGRTGNLYGVSAVDRSGNESTMATVTAESGESSR
jgi:hypothetical protein